MVAEVSLMKLPSDECHQTLQMISQHSSSLVHVMAWCRQATSHYLNQCWHRSVSPYGVIRPQLDESTAGWQLKSPQSLSGRSIHLTLVTKWSWSWSWMTHCHLLCAMSIGPPILRYSYFKIWPWKSMVKVMCVVKAQGHIWPLNSAKFKGQVQQVHIWGLDFSRYVCFSFRGNQTTFGWDKGNSIFDLENSRSRSWPRSNPMDTFEP